jgi:hypothetical protein
MKEKPLGCKNYGSIPHLPNSRLGPGDHKCNPGQARMATEKLKDSSYDVIVQEKLDGSNCGICLIDGTLYPLVRAGYPAYTSPFKMHHLFSNWVYENEERFRSVLNEGERIVGEWLAQAHGTIYDLPHEPFVVFDLIKDQQRLPFDDFALRVQKADFVLPQFLSRGQPCSIEKAMKILRPYGYHGAREEVEGAVWRIEQDKPVKKGVKKRVVSFLVKYVRPDKVDGKYLDPENPVWNTWEE